MAGYDAGQILLRPYWLSWVSRPEHGPYTLWAPWWISGYDGDDHPTVCAAVMAPDEETARQIVVESHDDPRRAMGAEFRFVEPKPDGWEPFCDRFGRRDWMRWPWPDAGPGDEPKGGG